MENALDNQVSQASLLEFRNIVFKEYLNNLQAVTVKPLDVSLQTAIEKITIKQITRIVYDKEEDNLSKFISVFSAMHNCDSTVAIILKGTKTSTDLYIATSKESSSSGYSGFEASETLRAAISGNFPGVKCDEIESHIDVQRIIESINSPANNYVTSIVGVPSKKEATTSNSVQGLEKIIDGLRGKEYMAVINAAPVSRQELEMMEEAYQTIYSALAVFEQSQMTFSESETTTLGQTLTEGLTTTIGKSISQTQTTTVGESSTESHSDSKTRSALDIKRAFAQALTGAAGGAVVAGAPTLGLGAGLGAAVGGTMGFLGGIFSGSKSSSDTFSNGRSHAETKGETSTKNQSEAHTATTADSNSVTEGSSRTIQMTTTNRVIKDVLNSIELQIERIREGKSYGMWNWGAYFVSEQKLNSKLGADLYSGILRGEITGLERSAITTWKRNSENSTYTEILKYIQQLKHPIFETPKYYRTSLISSASLISSKEVSIAMGLPQKSLPGIPVFQSIEFGRSISSYEGRGKFEEVLPIGSIFNLGSVDNAHKVELNIDSLASHTFITGSTGAGKSNCIYLMLQHLWKNNGLPFLVIEPSKGEYKNIFGGIDDIKVFGTNPKLTPLLKLNPFAFPDNVYITEHIDRLIEILNAVWPMYAAMPAVLKESVELSYKKVGWDLLQSTNAYGSGIYPDFHDLLKVMPGVISKSEYSEEVKSNYAGALLTRVRSLTNGYYKLIFQKEDLSSKILFDNPCIIDLSRVGSSETKAMIMGMVFLKLQEYRMDSNNRINSKLSHITVIEEAHNLLRRTNSNQSQETANLQGKAVEMISNSIAEMRSLGEGFIIADQSPGLLDQSVIRNTNTKIIFRLPDWDDRQLVGRAENLKIEQIEELARLKTGCAAIYQNNWQEAVLCQVNKFNHETTTEYKKELSEYTFADKREIRKKQLIELLMLAKISGKEPSEFVQEKGYDMSKIYMYFPHIKGMIKQKENSITNIIEEILQIDKLLDNESLQKSKNIDVWISVIKDLIKQETDLLNLEEKMQIELMKTVLDGIKSRNPDNSDLIHVYQDDLHLIWKGIE